MGYAGAVLPVERPAQVHDLDRKLYRDLNLKQGEIDANSAYRIWKACHDDLHLYAFKFVRTRDEADPESPIKPVPEEPDLVDLLTELGQQRLMAIPKSRQLFVSWTLAIYLTWLARFHPHRLCFWQSKREADAKNVVFNGEWTVSRMGIIEYFMPQPLYLGLKLRGSGGSLFYPTKSRIWGIPQGDNILRSYTASCVVMDEACFWDAFRQSYKAALAMVKSGHSQLLVCSTAKPLTYFAKLIGEWPEDYPVPEDWVA